MTSATVLISIAAIAISLASVAMPSADRGRGRFAMDSMLGALAISALLNHLMLPPFGPSDARPVNQHDFIHHHMGAKYLPELGYGRIYACMAQALGAPPDTPVRDLATKRMTTAADAISRAGCRERFSDSRWTEFSRDSAAFFDMAGERAILGVFRDHGFNAPPTWAAIASLTASQAPPTPARVMALGSIDAALLVLSVGLVWWAFGIRTASLASIVLATLPLAAPQWTIGSLLRSDWLFSMTASACLMRRGFPASSGAFMGLAACLRVFPAFPVLLLAALVAMKRFRGELPGGWARFGAGFAAGASALSLAAVSMFGTSAFYEFAGHIAAHGRAVSVNETGLLTSLAMLGSILSNGPLPDPEFARVKPETMGAVLIPYLAVASLSLFAIFRAAWKAPHWAVLCLMILAIPFAPMELSNYYCQFWLAAALLCSWKPSAAPVFLAGNLAMIATSAWLGPKSMTGFAAWSAILCIVAVAVALLPSKADKTSS